MSTTEKYEVIGKLTEQKAAAEGRRREIDAELEALAEERRSVQATADDYALRIRCLR